MKKKWIGCAMVSGFALMQASAAVAADETGLSEIVVTAQKREQKILDVPMSVSALTSADLEQRGIQSINDLSFAVPGMVLREDGPGSQQIWMRGIGNLAGTEALVSVYQDEIPVTLYGFRQLDLRALDIDRVEVLKGPQGTLYGQGAVAGTVRFVTKKPVMDRVEGRVEGELSSIQDGALNEKLTGIINVPIVNNVLAMRIAATREWGGGWIDQPKANLKDGNNQNLTNARIELRWQPNDDLRVDATVGLYRNRSKLGVNYEEPDHTIRVAVDPTQRLIPRDNRYQVYNLTGSYDFGFATLISATSYAHQNQDYPADYIAGPQTSYGVQLEGTSQRHDRTRQFTQEVRLVSNGDGPLHYTTGVFYRNVKSFFLDWYDTLYDGVYYPRVPYVSNNFSKSLSFFADVSYNVTDKLEIGAGIRRFRDQAKITDGVITQSGVFRSTDPRAYVSYAVADGWKVYANVAKGFRSGGFNRVPLPNFGPEKVINYEIGAKGSALNNRLQVQVAGYHSDYKDMLRRGLVFIPGSGFQDLTANIGKVEINGLEASVSYRVTPQLTLNATGSYIDSKVTEVKVETAANKPGDPADYVPKFSFTLGADYNFNWSSTVPGFLHVNYDYRGKVHFTDRFQFKPGYYTQSSDAAGIIDVRIGATFDRLSAELFCNNLTNTNKSIDPYVQYAQANRTKPRTIGIKGTLTF